jgi:hypothetical protein
VRVDVNIARKRHAHLLRSTDEGVVSHANRSHGTPYTYFDSSEVAIAELRLEFADEMTGAIVAINDVSEEPRMGIHCANVS